MSYFNENANPWLPRPGVYDTPLAPVGNAEKRVEEWRKFAADLQGQFDRVVAQRDLIAGQREEAYNQRDGWKETAKELRANFCPNMTDEQLVDRYVKHKALVIEKIEREKQQQQN